MAEIIENTTVEKLSHLAQINDPIDLSLYQKYDVKRGLRYADGRGVRALGGRFEFLVPHFAIRLGLLRRGALGIGRYGVH